MRGVFTFLGCAFLLEVSYTVFPGEIGSQPIQGRKLRLLASYHEASMGETDYVAFLRLPSSQES